LDRTGLNENLRNGNPSSPKSMRCGGRRAAIGSWNETSASNNSTTEAKSSADDAMQASSALTEQHDLAVIARELEARRAP
jgi:hypothetical protein